MSNLVIFVGPSGSGKSMMADYMQKRYNAAKIISTTNRTMRPGEVDGRDYHFVSDKEFTDMTLRHEFFEYAQYSGNYYGTTKAEVDAKLTSAEWVVNVMEICGAKEIKNLVPECTLIYMDVPIVTLMHRMNDRGDTFESIAKRVENYVKTHEDKNEMYCDSVIHNTGTIEEAKAQLDAILANIKSKKS